MTTKYNVRQKVWFFSDSGLTEGVITEIRITKDNVILYTLQRCPIMQDETIRSESNVFLTIEDIMAHVNIRVHKLNEIKRFG